jgi:hypothetical protein
MKKNKIEGQLLDLESLLYIYIFRKRSREKKIAKPSENHTIIDKPVND